MIIEHIAMYVNDLEKAKDFFVKYFNARSNNIYHNNITDFSSYFLSFDNGARLELMAHPEMQNIENPARRTGFVHIAFSVGSKDRVDELTKTIENDGYKVLSYPRTTGDGYYESCIVDFEGNQIEITI